MPFDAILIRLGLTGSLASGKSTVARMFADRGLPVHESDACVHRLYRPGGAATAPVADAFGDVLNARGGVDHDVLARLVWSDPGVRRRLEAIVHPLVAKDRDAFLDRHAHAGAPLAVLDIPLLFETGAENDVDRVLVAICNAEELRRRALARPGMTEERYLAIRSAQMSDEEKRARADYVVDTDRREAEIASRVDGIIAELGT